MDIKMITEKNIQDLISGDLPMREHRRMLEEAENLASQIWAYILKVQGRQGGGWDFPSYWLTSDEEYICLEWEDWSSWGSFDHSEFKEGFPKRFLWTENWRQEIDEIVAKEKDLEKVLKEKKRLEQIEKSKKEAARKELRKTLLLSIKTKLTPEELKVVATDLSGPEKRLLK